MGAQMSATIPAPGARVYPRDAIDAPGASGPCQRDVFFGRLRIGACQIFHEPLAHGLNDIQELSKSHDMVFRAKTELWHRLLTHYLPLYFPEAERFRGNARSDWFLAFLEAFPMPSTIQRLAKEEFIAAA